MKSLQLEHDNCKGMFKQGRPYSLCLGAGICIGIMPDWEELTYKVLKSCINPKLTELEFKAISKDIGWSLDSMLQASLNHLIQSGGDIGKFNEILQLELYSSIIDRAEKCGIGEELKRFISNPFSRDNNHILDLYAFFKKEYESTSLFQVAEYLLKASSLGYAPKSILTFNADVLLHSLLTLMQLKETHDETGKAFSADFKYKPIHNIIESDGHKVPIYHIHGSIVPNSGAREARHNLVFPESSYHDVAGSTFSWQQNIFQYYAQRTRMVFIGLSMSDLNIRRWLSHTNSVLNQDVYNMTGREENVTNHLWVTTPSSNETETEIKKLGLYHLGVKVSEINEWSKLQPALLNLIS